MATWPDLCEGNMNQNPVSLTFYSPWSGRGKCGQKSGAISRAERTNTSQNGSVPDEDRTHWAEAAVRRKQLLLQRFGNGRRGVGSTSKSCFTWPSALTACRWLLQMLLDPSKSVIKPWLFCRIAASSWLRLEKQQTNVISASPCSCCPSQKDHRKQSVFLWEPISWEGWQRPRSACPTQRRQSRLYLTGPQGLLKT